MAPVEEHVRAGGADVPGAVFRRLLDTDTFRAQFPDLAPEVQSGERHFFVNTLQGLGKEAERRLVAG